MDKSQLTNPAKYRNVIKFEEFKSTQDGEGHWTETWIDSDLGTTFAQIRNIRGKEFIEAGALQAELSARINTRYRKDVEQKYYELGEKMRLNFNGRIFNIVYLNNLEECNIELEFIVDEVV